LCDIDKENSKYAIVIW